jgi:hypothetical protein
MKKAYNETWVQNLEIQRMSRSWQEKNLLTTAQFEQVKTNFPESFYRPGIFVKIGLFLFTLVAGSFFSGFISLFFLDKGGEETLAAMSILCSACFFFALEYFIKDRKLFHSGIDNALLYMATGAALIPVFIIFDDLKIWQYCLFILIINFFVCLRYADIFTTLVGIIVLYTFFANLLIGFPLGKALLPFALMLISALIYIINKKKRDVYYRDSQSIVEIVALIVFYLGGNYYVVREGNAMLSDILSPLAPQIPFATLFYLFTATIPLLYLVIGLKNKDRVMVILGLLITAFSFFTYRYYFSIIPIEVSLVLAGALLITLSVLCIHYLKTPKFGLTDEKLEKRNLANLEALLIAHHFGQAPAEKNLEFGGGDFGGGGSGNEY